MKKLLAIIIFAVMLFAFAVTASAAETVTLNAPLDFTAETLPAPGENDLWSYEEATKTLTLKDGLNLTFSGFAEEVNTAIILPDGATIVIEGKAYISSENDCILSKGSLDIEFADGAVLELYVSEFDYNTSRDYGIIVNNDLTITASEKAETVPQLVIMSNYDCIQAINGAVTVENIYIDFYSHCCGIFSKTDKDYAVLKESGKSFPITLTNVNGIMDVSEAGFGVNFGGIYLTDCDINIDASDEVVITEVGDIKIIKSQLVIDTDDEEGITIYEDGDLYITESTVTVESEEDGIEITGDIFITDSTVTVKNDEKDGIKADDVWIYIGDEVIYKGGNITITGSTVTVDTKTEGAAIQADGNFTITDSEFDMEILDKGNGVNTFYHLFGVQGTISIDGKFVLESEGTEIYRGEYTTDLEYDGSEIDGNWITGWKTLVIIGENGTITEAYRIYSVHTHEYNKPVHDDENHWEECECGHKINEEAHTHEPKLDDDYHWEECECGHIVNKELHAHEPKLDSEHHWEECACGHIINKEIHAHEPKLDDDYHWEECECGHIINKELHAHEPKLDSEHHWEECECGHIINKELHAHELKLDDENHWEECECGHIINKELHAHEPKLDGEHHWEECACGHIVNKELHEHHQKHDANGHWLECECGYSIQYESHSLVWKIITPATEKDSGLKSHWCPDCGYVEISKVYYLENPGVTIITPGEKTEGETNPNTGAPVIAPFVIAALVSGAVIIKKK